MYTFEDHFNVDTSNNMFVYFLENSQTVYVVIHPLTTKEIFVVTMYKSQPC